MAGPNILCSDVGALGGLGAATAFELRGGRFAKQVGNSDIDMRQVGTANYESHAANSMCWFRGRLYWCSGEGVSGAPNFAVTYVKRLNESTDTWETVYTVGVGSGTNKMAKAIYVVTTGTQEFLVIVGTRTAFGVTSAPWWAKSETGEVGSWTRYESGSQTTHAASPGGISHAGLLFMVRPGNNAFHNFTSFDPVTGSFSLYGNPDPIRIDQGALFKFDNRLLGISPTSFAAEGGLAQFVEFTFGSWVRMLAGAGHLGVNIFFGALDNTTSSRIPAAVQIDDDTVILFGSGDVGGGAGLRAYEVTLSAGSGSQFTVADVTATYIPPALLPGGGLGAPLEYAMFNVGKGDDGFWYLAFSGNVTNGAYSLIRVIPGGLLQDAGVMQAQNSYSIVTASMDGGERRDSRGALPLVKPFPLGTSEGVTGMIQNFRCDGDPLIAEHGVVGGTPPFVEGEAVSWPGGTGIILDDGVGASAIRMHTLTGVVPDGLLMTGAGGATATCSTSSGNGQAHTVRMQFFKDASSTGLGAPRVLNPGAPAAGYCKMVAGSGVNCTVQIGAGPGGSDQAVTDADGSGQVKSFEWDFLTDTVPPFATHNVKLQASRV